MKDYPQTYDTTAFPDARHLAMSRTFAVWSGVAFLIIVGLVGVFLWTSASLRMAPFLISIDDHTGEWSVVSEKTPGARIYTATHAMQESVVGNFTRRWFTISANTVENDARWCTCDPAGCARNHLEERTLPCLVCCASGAELFSRFSREVAYDYRERVAAGETWTVDEDSIHMRPMSDITDRGGLWHVALVVRSNIIGPIGVEAYVRVAHSDTSYPLTMGFFVADYNAFRKAE